MEESNVDVEKLKKVIDGIFAAGGKAVEQFNCDDYTDEELNYIMRELGGATMRELDGLIEDVGEYDKQEQSH